MRQLCCECQGNTDDSWKEEESGGPPGGKGLPPEGRGRVSRGGQAAIKKFVDIENTECITLLPTLKC